MLEAKNAGAITFVTLTYDDDHLPADGSLVPADVRFFLKKLRRKAGLVRFFAVGEYGGKNFRPHYHLILFGVEYSDAWQKVFNECWTLDGKLRGFAKGEKPRFASWALSYVLGYTIKKMTAQDDERLCGRHPEFFRCSRYPTLGTSGLNALATALGSSRISKVIARNGFPRGFRLEGNYYPFFDVDRQRVMERSGYAGAMDAPTSEDVAIEYEEDLVRADLERQQKPAHYIEDRVFQLRTAIDEEKQERERQTARLRAAKAARLGRNRERERDCPPEKAG